MDADLIVQISRGFVPYPAQSRADAAHQAPFP
jgi:hypothetical protein